MLGYKIRFKLAPISGHAHTVQVPVFRIETELKVHQFQKDFPSVFCSISFNGPIY